MPTRSINRSFLAAFLLTLLALVGTSLATRGDGAFAPVALASTQYADTPAAPTSPFAVRWAFYVTYSSNSWDSLVSSVKQLNYVSPYLFYVGKDGLVTGKDESRVSSLLWESKVKNLPMIKNTAVYTDFTTVITDTAANTHLTVTIGGRCFTRAASKITP